MAATGSSRRLDPEEILAKCDKELDDDDDDDSFDDDDVDQELRKKHKITDSYKSLYSDLASMNKQIPAENRMITLTKAVKTLEKSFQNSTATTDLVSFEIRLLEQCSLSTREALNSLEGSLELNPAEAGKKMRKVFDDMMKITRETDEADVDGEIVNPLMIDEPSGSEQDSDADYDSDKEEDVFVGPHSFHLNPKRFGARLMFLDIMRERVASAAGDVVPTLFDIKEHESLLRKDASPSMLFNARSMDNMLPMVDTKGLEKEKEKEKQQRKRKADPKSEMVKLKDTSKATEMSETVSIGLELDHLKKCLKKTLRETATDRINYYKFIINPTNFGKSIENIFYVSYLIKDKVVFITVGDDGFPYLRLTKPLDAKDQRNIFEKNHFQSIFPFDYQSWESLSELLDIKEACIEPMTEGRSGHKK